MKTKFYRKKISYQTDCMDNEINKENKNLKLIKKKWKAKRKEIID